MDAVPVWALLVGTFALVLLAIECGHRLGGHAKLHPDDVKVPPVSSIVGSVLGLLAFMLAFTFGMVANRFDSRKSLVREEANVIRTAWMRTDLLPEPDRAEAAALVATYVDRRVAAVKSGDLEEVKAVLAESVRIQHKLWDIASANGRRAPTSPVAAQFTESVNRMVDLHALRSIAGLQSRVPWAIWLGLYSLLFLGMTVVGYHTAVAASTRRSWAPPLLALSFSLVISLVAALDRPQSGLFTVSQQPLVDVQEWMAARGDVSETGHDKR
jgi:hypothetical protein